MEIGLDRVSGIDLVSSSSAYSGVLLQADGRVFGGGQIVIRQEKQQQDMHLSFVVRQENV